MTLRLLTTARRKVTVVKFRRVKVWLVGRKVKLGSAEKKAGLWLVKWLKEVTIFFCIALHAYHTYVFNLGKKYNFFCDGDVTAFLKFCYLLVSSRDITEYRKWLFTSLILSSLSLIYITFKLKPSFLSGNRSQAVIGQQDVYSPPILSYVELRNDICRYFNFSTF